MNFGDARYKDEIKDAEALESGIGQANIIAQALLTAHREVARVQEICFKNTANRITAEEGWCACEKERDSLRTVAYVAEEFVKADPLFFKENSRCFEALRTAINAWRQQ